MRVYRGTKPYLTATFSDATAGSMRTALKAALAIHTAYADLSPDQGLPFD